MFHLTWCHKSLFRLWRQRLLRRPKSPQKWKRHLLNNQNHKMLFLPNLSLRCRWVISNMPTVTWLSDSKYLLGVVWFLPSDGIPLLQVQPEPASPTPMETSGCEPADLCQAFSDVMLHTAIRDVDADDYDNPMLCSEYVKDIYKYLRQLEASDPSAFPKCCQMSMFLWF